MSQVKNLPKELSEFLSLEGPQTLLLRGGPGAGKTSLCFQMLNEFQGRTLYVTCRVPAEKIRQDFHWLVGPDPVPWKILDLTSRPSSLEDAAKVLLNAKMMLSSSEDSSEVLRALWLPGAIQEAWGDADPNEPTLIVVDPWNAFIEQYVGSGQAPVGGAPTIREIERTLLSLIGRTKIHLVFVMEGDEQTPLDYLVDGVLVVRREQFDAHMERWLTLSKLRGIPIDLPLYPFTLDGGRFRCITPTEGRGGLSTSRPEPDPESKSPGLWPGNADFGRIFGRLPVGSMTLIELAAEVPREVVRVLLFPAIAHALGAGGRVVLVPPPTLNAEDSYSGLPQLVPEKVLAQRFRILGVFPSHELGESLRQVFVPPSRISWTKDGVTVPVPEDPAFRVRAHSSKSTNLMVVYFSGLEGLAHSAGAALTREAIPGSAQVTFGGDPVHLIAIGRAGDAYFREVSPLASLHLRVESRQGRVLLHSYRPFSEEFAVTQESEDTPYHLLRLN